MGGLNCITLYIIFREMHVYAALVLRSNENRHVLRVIKEIKKRR